MNSKLKFPFVTIFLVSLTTFLSASASTLDSLDLSVSPNFKIINEKEDLEFEVDLSKLKNGDLQYAMTFTQANDFDNDKVLTLDRHQLKEKEDKAMFIVSKTAYVVPGKSPDFFNSKLFNSPHYVTNTFADTEASESGTPNLLKITRLVNFGPINIGRIHFDLMIEELNAESDRDFVQRVLDFDMELGTPAKVSALYMTNADKMLNGTYIINKYYDIAGKGTLVVSVQFSSVKKVPLPMFVIRGQAISSAHSEGKAFVKAIRAYEGPK